MNTIDANHPAAATVASANGAQLPDPQEGAFAERLQLHGFNPEAVDPHVQAQTGPAVHVTDLHELERLAGVPQKT
jgi:hypothetical protein